MDHRIIRASSMNIDQSDREAIFSVLHRIDFHGIDNSNVINKHGSNINHIASSSTIEEQQQSINEQNHESPLSHR